METPLTPLEFVRRSRRLYPDHEAVVDGDVRWTYEQFFAHCDRWSAVLQRQLGVQAGDRVAYIAPNTAAQLASFYAVPQLGAVLVPINYRLTADDFAYIIGHSGARVVCAHPDYLEMVDAIRDRIPGAVHFVALEGARAAWLDYAALVEASDGAFVRPVIAETDLLTINYTSGTTARPKGVMITHRNAYMNAIGTMLHAPMAALAERYLWTLPMFHANGWTFVWIVTAAGGTHVCLRRVEPPRIFAALAEQHARGHAAQRVPRHDVHGQRTVFLEGAQCSNYPYACDDDSGASGRALIQRDFPAGRYHVVVDGYGSPSQGEYSVSVQTRSMQSLAQVCSAAAPISWQPCAPSCRARA